MNQVALSDMPWLKCFGLFSIWEGLLTETESSFGSSCMAKALVPIITQRCVKPAVCAFVIHELGTNFKHFPAREIISTESLLWGGARYTTVLQCLCINPLGERWKKCIHIFQTVHWRRAKSSHGEDDWENLCRKGGRAKHNTEMLLLFRRGQPSAGFSLPFPLQTTQAAI